MDSVVILKIILSAVIVSCSGIVTKIMWEWLKRYDELKKDLQNDLRAIEIRVKTIENVLFMDTDPEKSIIYRLMCIENCLKTNKNK